VIIVGHREYVAKESARDERPLEHMLHNFQTVAIPCITALCTYTYIFNINIILIVIVIVIAVIVIAIDHHHHIIIIIITITITISIIIIIFTKIIIKSV